jgi:hypothetical protein
MKRFVDGDHVAAADDVIVRLPPLHILAVDGLTVGVAGEAFRLTTVVAVVVQVPVAGLVALNVYMPGVGAVITGLKSVEVYPPGPAHE